MLNRVFGPGILDLRILADHTGLETEARWFLVPMLICLEIGENICIKSDCTSFSRGYDAAGGTSVALRLFWSYNGCVIITN